MKRRVIGVYVSPHGHTRRAALSLPNVEWHDLDCVWPVITDDAVIVFFCPTYGDEELPERMEEYLESLPRVPALYAVCELGAYYGYEEKPFGALTIIEGRLRGLGWRPVCRPLSLDSLPAIRWEDLEDWKKGLDDALRAVGGEA